MKRQEIPGKTAGLISVWLLFAVATAGTPPICTGISDVSGFDGPQITDMQGFLTTVPVATGLSSPTFIDAPPGDLERLFVLEQAGEIRLIKNGTLLPDPFLNIPNLVGCCGEEGLLGLAFHPDYDTNGWFFIYHSDNSGDNVVARYTRDSTNSDLADPASRVEVIKIDHPIFPNHNGGMLAFGPDGRLYVGVGDGGNGCDPGPGIGNAQSIDVNLGKLLRLDVDSLPYGTSGNPYDGATPGNDEIWAFGLRNPWRFSFDRETDNLYVGDVGELVHEEVNCATSTTAGKNYGWVPYEGNECPPLFCGGTAEDCVLPDHAAPVYSYDHSVSPRCAIIGGHVYRGCRMGDLRGTYFFGDLCAADILTFRTDAECAVGPVLDRTAALADNVPLPLLVLSSFGEDQRGELYVADLNGFLLKIVPVLPILETSGIGAFPFTPTPPSQGGVWVWEDLRATTSHPLVLHRVYRSDGDPVGPFDCLVSVTQSSCGGGSCAWVDGDPAIPPIGDLFFYLVTSRDGNGAETRPGNRSDGTLRSVESQSVCSN